MLCYNHVSCCYITYVMSCLLYNMCHVMLSNMSCYVIIMSHVMLYNVSLLCYIKGVMFCYITCYFMLYNIRHVIV